MAADAATAEMAAASLCDDLEPATIRTRIRDVLAAGAARAGDRVVVGGWVRTGREQGKGSFAFLELSDGSCAAALQVIVDAAVYSLARLTATGTSVLVEGEIKEPPQGTKQNVELKVSRVLQVGEVDAAAYPLPKGKVKIPLETLRDVVHLRSRTNTVGALLFATPCSLWPLSIVVCRSLIWKFKKLCKLFGPEMLNSVE
jgi:asparaginyl-tRNA synthetase